MNRELKDDILKVPGGPLTPPGKFRPVPGLHLKELKKRQ